MVFDIKFRGGYRGGDIRHPLTDSGRGVAPPL